MRERDVERRFKAECEKRGWLVRKFTSPGHRGVPDRIVVGPGWVEFVELKAPGKKPRREQLVEFERYRMRGYPVDVLDSNEAVMHWVLKRASIVDEARSHQTGMEKYGAVWKHTPEVRVARAVYETQGGGAHETP